MIKVFSGLVFCSVLFACTSTTQETSDDLAISDAPESYNEQQLEPYELKWLAYADPIADANLAIAKNDFTLLAFSNRGIRFPGVSEEAYDLETLTKVCGVKVLKGTGDMLQQGQSLERRKKLRAYAKQYNNQVFKVCSTLLFNE